MTVQIPARILLVDDEAMIRLTLAALLQRRGYAVETATNGEEALSCLTKRRFDLLLIDLKLPGMNGLVVAQHAHKSQPSVPILFLTGSSDFNGMSVEEQVGYFDYILKTASPEEVLERVRSAIVQYA
ncbi:MAG: response regulator [Kouleothrix sp.]|nr:response regulator [Kouleothrix sp.]